MGCALSSADISGEGYRIKIIKEIAKGGFGVVLQCQDVDGGDLYAIKKIVATSQIDVDRIENEAKMHRMLSHVPQVVLLVALIQNLSENFLVFPFYSNGTVAELLEKRKLNELSLDEEQVARFFESICMAVDGIHKKNYAHRDLKTANFLISNDGKSAHLTDFGSAAEMPFVIKDSKDHHKYLDETGELCSMPYRAPELFSCDIGSTITESIDIWSLGCCLYALCFFASPFDTVYEKGGSIALASQSPHKIPYPEDTKYSEELINLIKNMLQVEPESRPKISEILEGIRKIEKSTQNGVEQPVVEDRVLNT